MRAPRIAVAVAVLGLAGAARAESPVPGNYVDDFGSVAPAAQRTVDVNGAVASRGSPIPANYVDDFGSLLPRSVSVPPQREELGAASGEPGRAGGTLSAQPSDEKAGADAYQHDRFVRDVWARP